MFLDFILSMEQEDKYLIYDNRIKELEEENEKLKKDVKAWRKYAKDKDVIINSLLKRLCVLKFII